MEFWKLEEFARFLDFEEIPRVSKIPNLVVDFSGFWTFGNSLNFGFLDFEAPARVSKTPKLGLEFLDFWIFGNSRNFGFLDLEAPARVSKNPNLGVDFFDFWNVGISSGSSIFGWVLVHVNGIRITFIRGFIRLKGISIGLGSDSSSRIPTNSC